MNTWISWVFAWLYYTRRCRRSCGCGCTRIEFPDKRCKPIRSFFLSRVRVFRAGKSLLIKLPEIASLDFEDFFVALSQGNPTRLNLQNFQHQKRQYTNKKSQYFQNLKFDKKFVSSTSWHNSWYKFQIFLQLLNNGNFVDFFILNYLEV